MTMKIFQGKTQSDQGSAAGDEENNGESWGNWLQRKKGVWQLSSVLAVG